MKCKKTEKNVLNNPVVACVVGAVAMFVVSRLLQIQFLNPCN